MLNPVSPTPQNSDEISQSENPLREALDFDRIPNIGINLIEPDEIPSRTIDKILLSTLLFFVVVMVVIFIVIL